MEKRKSVPAIFGQGMAIAAGEHHRLVGPAGPDFLAQLDAIHPRHDDIREYDIDIVVIHFQNGDRLERIGCPLGYESQIAKQLRRKFADLVIILYDENACFRRIDPRCRNVCAHLVQCGDTAKIQAEHRALTNFADNVDLTTGLLGESIDLGKAEARALAHFLGREKWLEDTLRLLWGDPGSSIDHRDFHIVALGSGMSPSRRNTIGGHDGDFDAPFSVHRIARIHREIHKRGFELACIDFDAATFPFSRNDEIDTRAHHGPQHIGHRFHAGDGVENLGPQSLPTGEGEKLPCQLCCPVGGF